MTQAATIDPVVDLATPEVDIGRIRVKKDYNPRKLKDPEALQALADNIADIGMTEPLVVSPPDEEGFFDLLDGERRLEAATIAGEKMVPITINRGGSEITDAANYHREGLDPVAQARSWKAMAEEHNLTTHKAIAVKAKVKRVGKVSAHRARLQVAAKKELPGLDLLRYERFAEGTGAQVLYVGPYQDEGPTIAALHEFITAQGLVAVGRHHEIYLGDPRRSAPEKLRTVIRQPVAPEPHHLGG